MVFFTSILIVCILYYLQADGLIYVTIVAVTAELINIFMTQILTKSVEKKMDTQFKKIVAVYKDKINSQTKAIKELEDIQEKSATKIHNSNLKIKEYEEKFGIQVEEDGDDKPKDQENEAPPEEEAIKEPENFIDLPPGSGRKELPT